MADFEVTSEIYSEKDYLENSKRENNKKNVSRFYYNYPLVDSDGDLIVRRKTKKQDCNFIEIEHSSSTVLKLVGLQIWRGALLLGDLLMHLGPESMRNSTVLEVGSGVGLTSIVASRFATHVICTDVNVGGILDLIKSNFRRNSINIKDKYTVTELDFFSDKWSEELEELLPNIDIILAADVIYDNDITDAFMRTIERLLSIPPNKQIYVALEKRFVFTIADLDSVAPCYEHFLLRLSEMLARQPKYFTAIQMDLDFPKYFKYDRVKHLVLWKISSEY